MKEIAVHLIRWQDAQNSYLFGSTIDFREDGQVAFENQLMSPGKTITSWCSMTIYQSQRKSPDLPILERNKMYQLTLKATTAAQGQVYLKLQFFDRNNQPIQTTFIKEKQGTFTYPNTAYYYTIDLLNAGCPSILFDYIVLSPKGQTYSSLGHGYYCLGQKEISKDARQVVAFEEPKKDIVLTAGEGLSIQSCHLQTDFYLTKTVRDMMLSLSQKYEHILIKGCGPYSNFAACYYATQYSNASLEVSGDFLSNDDYKQAIEKEGLPSIDVDHMLRAVNPKRPRPLIAEEELLPSHLFFGQERRQG